MAEQVVLQRFRPQENKPSVRERANIAHVVNEHDEATGENVMLCGVRVHETREIPTDYRTRLCRKCMAAKDAADTRLYRDATRRERRIREVLV